MKPFARSRTSTRARAARHLRHQEYAGDVRSPARAWFAAGGECEHRLCLVRARVRSVHAAHLQARSTRRTDANAAGLNCRELARKDWHREATRRSERVRQLHADQTCQRSGAQALGVTRAPPGSARRASSPTRRQPMSTSRRASFLNAPCSAPRRWRDAPPRPLSVVSQRRCAPGDDKRQSSSSI